MRFADCVSFFELEALMPPDAAAEPEALAPADVLDSSVLVSSSAILEEDCTGCQERGKSKRSRCVVTIVQKGGEEISVSCLLGRDHFDSRKE